MLSEQGGKFYKIISKQFDNQAEHNVNGNGQRLQRACLPNLMLMAHFHCCIVNSTFRIRILNELGLILMTLLVLTHKIKIVPL